MRSILIDLFENLFIKSGNNGFLMNTLLSINLYIINTNKETRKV